MNVYHLFFFLGFVNDFTSIAESYLLRLIGLNIADIHLASYTINGPWLLRVVWGYLSDRLKRRKYQLAVLFFTAFVLWMLVREAESPAEVITLLTLCEIAPAMGITIADAYAVRMIKQADPDAMARHHAFRIVSRILTSFVSGHLLTAWGTERDGLRAIFLIQAIAYLVYTPVCLYLISDSNEDYAVVQQKPESAPPAETPTEPSPPAGRCAFTREMFRIIWRNPSIRNTVALFTVYAMLPDAGTSVSYFVIGPLAMEPHVLGYMDVARGLLELVGTRVNKSVPLTRAAAVNLAIANLMCIPIMALVCRTVAHTIDDRAILMMNTCITSLFSSCFVSIYQVSIATVSPEGKEGGIFSGIVTVPMLGQLISVASTYALTRWYGIDHDDFQNLAHMVLTTSIAGSVVSIAGAYLLSDRATRM